MKILVNFEEKIQTEEKQRRYKFIANQFLRAREQSLTNRINIVELKQRLVLEEALTPKENFRKSTQKRFRFDFSIKQTDLPVGLIRTGHMSFLTRKEQTPKFARLQNFYTFYKPSTAYQDKVPGHKFGVESYKLVEPYSPDSDCES